MSEKKTLEGADLHMEYRRIGEDILWGFKSFRENPSGPAQFVLEIYYRDDEHPEPIYLREKVVGDPVLVTGTLPFITQWIPRMVEILTRLATEPEYRDEIREQMKDPFNV